MTAGRVTGTTLTEIVDVRSIRKGRPNDDKVKAYQALQLDNMVGSKVDSTYSSIAPNARNASCHQVPITPSGLTSSFSSCEPLSLHW